MLGAALPALLVPPELPLVLVQLLVPLLGLFKLRSNCVLNLVRLIAMQGHTGVTLSPMSFARCRWWGCRPRASAGTAATR